jgi:hypothetical protein
MEPYFAFVRLINNVDLICIIKSEDSVEITLEKPIEMNIELDRNSLPVSMFYAWLPTASLNSNLVTIGRDKVFFALPLKQEVVDKLSPIMDKCYQIKPVEFKTVDAKSNLDIMEDLLNGNIPDKKN